MDKTEKIWQRLQRMIDTLTNTTPKVHNVEKALAALRKAQLETDPAVLRLLDLMSDQELFCYVAHHYV